MPIYEYRCTNGHNFEVMQRMSDGPVTSCQVCGAPVERVFHPIAVHFKGSGFYNTDYGTRKRSRERAENNGGDSSKSSSDGKTGTESKPSSDSGGSGSESKTTTSSGSTSSGSSSSSSSSDK